MSEMAYEKLGEPITYGCMINVSLSRKWLINNHANRGISYDYFRYMRQSCAKLICISHKLTIKYGIIILKKCGDVMEISNIYIITNKINNKQYVGQAIDPEYRFKQHLRDYKNKRYKSRYLYNAINKHGVENFIFTVVETNIPIDSIGEREMYWINQLNTLAPNGYNLTKGGEGTIGFHHSEETKQKISEIVKEKAKNYGKKISEKKKGSIISEEQKKKISNTLKGRTDHIDKARDGFFKFLDSMNDEQKKDYYAQRAENHPKKKPILMIDTITDDVTMEFGSMRKASEWLRSNTIHKTASHTRLGVVCDTDNTAYGYKWKYK